MYTANIAAALPQWALQGNAARAIYAARNTLTPKLAGSAVPLASLPHYGAHWPLWGPVGLTVASGVAILGHFTCLLVLAPRVIPELRATLSPALKRLGAAVLLSFGAGVATWLAATGVTAALPWRGHLGALAAAAAGTAAFLGVVALFAGPLGVEEPGLIVARLRRGRRSKSAS
jgi:hypothetical protein